MQNQSNSRVIVLAAGGTGGHIFPAEALAEEMLKRGYSPHLVTDHRFHQYNKSSADGVLGSIPIHTITAGSLGGGMLSRAKNGLGLLRGTMQARKILKELKPLAVVGFGGYPSFPTMAAAILGNRVTVIHEQNSVLGRVNRLFANRVKQLATTYGDTRGLKNAPHAMTGNPVRGAIRALANVEYPELSGDGMLRLLVIGGSQGASVFSRVIPEAMKLLPPHIRARVRLDQQCRAGEIEQVRKAYSELGMQVDLAPFFADVAARLASAHLVIARAGASTVAELTAAGRPAILVPLPQATDNHQYYNAQAIEDVGGGWVIAQDAFTPQVLADKIETLVMSPQRLAECAAAMHGIGRPDASAALADCVLAAAGITPKTNGNGAPTAQELAA